MTLWLVVKQPSWKIWKSMGRIIPHIIMENKTCSKPPTRISRDSETRTPMNHIVKPVGWRSSFQSFTDRDVEIQQHSQRNQTKQVLALEVLEHSGSDVFICISWLKKTDFLLVRFTSCSVKSPPNWLRFSSHDPFHPQEPQTPQISRYRDVSIPLRGM